MSNEFCNDNHRLFAGGTPSAQNSLEREPSIFVWIVAVSAIRSTVAGVASAHGGAPVGNVLQLPPQSIPYFAVTGSISS